MKVIQHKKPNAIQKPIGEKIFDAGNVIFMILMIIIMAYPMWYVLSVSLSSAKEVNKGGFFLWPRDFTIDSYSLVFQEDGIPRSYLNTVLYTVGGTFFSLLFTSMIAYTLSVQDFVFKKFLTVFLTITMFIGGGMIPSYLLMKELHLLDTYWVIVIPGCVGAYNVVLFRTFFKGNAMELREAAMIDGASEFRIYVQIVVPLSTAIFATMGLFAAVGHWNGYFGHLIYLKSSEKFPYQLILRRLLNSVSELTQAQDTNNEMVQQALLNRKYNSKNLQMAAIFIGMAPILCVYPFVQKYFVKGMFVGSLKG